MSNNIPESESKQKLSETEQELYDALLDEYNDIFENILIMNEKKMFDKILENVKAILGEKKMSTFSKMVTAKVLSSLKLANYLPDINSLKHIKEILISFGKKDRNHKMPFLKIDEIFSHCEKCSKCFHTCGEILLKPSAFDFIICLKCKMVYKKELIHLFCNECKEEYYSYIIDDSEPEYENFFPATWEKYHCDNFIYEEMTCPKCDWMLYYNEKEDLLKCFECGWKCLAKEKNWVCEICDKQFKSKVREYFRFETKPRVNCVRDALVQKIEARPAEMPCCNEDPRYFTFLHEKNGCKGILYTGYLQGEEMAVCAECRLVQKILDVFWTCPDCHNNFFCKKKKDFNNNKNIYMIKPKTSIKTNSNSRNYDNIRNTHNAFDRSITSENMKPKNIFYKESNSKEKELVLNNLSNKKYKKNVINNESNSEENNSNKSKEKFDNDEDSIEKSKQLKTKKIIIPFMYKEKKNLKLSLNGKKNIKNIKLYKKEESENNILYDNNHRGLIKTPKNMNLNFEKQKINFFSSKKDISLNSSSDFYLREMKIISLKNQKYINKSKIKFNKSLNDYKENINSNKNKNKNQILYSEKNDINKDNKRINLNLNLNININNYLSRSHSINNAHNCQNKLRNKITPKNYLNLRNTNVIKSDIEPNENFIPEDFVMIKQIGEGSFGKIYCSEWKKNGKKYAMKKMILRNKIEIKKNQDQTDLVYDLIKQTKTNGVIKIYGAQCIKITPAEFHFYVLMELANIDWEKEIKKRKDNKEYYTEGELFDILKQLTKTFSLLQKNNITHRDIKPQNVLIVNGVYKVCDFGEAKVTDGNDVIRQTIKGTELYMSPILFRALNKRQKQLIHNTYKSDVFSLGMCIFLAATLSFQSLYDIRELNDMDKIKNILIKYLIAKFSYDFVHVLVKMLEVNEDSRPDFIELEKILDKK